MSTAMKNRMMILAGASAAIALFAGCAAQQGSDGGRIPSSESTRAERRSDQVTIQNLDEFADFVAQSVVLDLKDVPEISQSPKRATVIFGDIVNKTGNVPTTDLEAIRRRINQRVARSDVFREKARWVAERRAVESARAKEGPLEGSVVVDQGQTIFDPYHTYYLNFEVFRLNRGNVNDYKMSCTLMRHSDGTEVWVSPVYDNGKQVMER
ncbi:MAG: hypothetical protein HRU70_04450 [Phycisphaeraceae bacterium]|nr:MAG: hypothetical protein HRU70_04450 [Phycisphaeraceae bacterium]